MKEIRLDFSEVLRTEKSEMAPINGRFLHAILGMSDEAGEMVSLAKRTIYYRTSFDMINFKEELGDMWWYMRLAMLEMAVIENKQIQDVFQEVIDMNTAKLRSRYSDGYSDDKAVNRDLQKERETLENKSP